MTGAASGCDRAPPAWFFLLQTVMLRSCIFAREMRTGFLCQDVFMWEVCMHDMCRLRTVQQAGFLCELTAQVK